MDASTLFYLSKIANTYPGMAAAYALIRILIILDPNPDQGY